MSSYCDCLSILSRNVWVELAHPTRVTKGADFNDIFASLDDGNDCIASGTTITPARSKIAEFCAPYAVSGQSLVVDVSRHPNVHGIDDSKAW